MFNDIVKETGLGKRLLRICSVGYGKKEVILRTDKSFMEAQRVFEGRGGITHNLRNHLYILKQEDKDSIELECAY